MSRTTSFQFTDKPPRSTKAFVVRIPAKLTSAEALLRALYEQAQLPGYFGFTWDALSDCLRDLHWVKSHKVILHHDDLPALPPHDLQTYLDVLAESVASWAPGDDHSLHVVFPSSAHAQLVQTSASK